MVITIKVDAPIALAESVKECLAMHLEHIGNVTITQIIDDGYQKQNSFDI